MRRFQQDSPAMARQRAVSRRHGGTRPGDDLGRFRKRHALDCGRVRCHVCHGSKYPRRESHEHEVRADLSFAEQVRERIAIPDDDCWTCNGLGWIETHAVEGGWSDGPTCHWCGGTGRADG